MPYILVSLISVLDVVFILIRNKVKNEIGLVFKMLSSINFIIFAIICFILNKSSNINYSLYIFGGLSFGFIGDFLLGVRRIAKNKHLFLIGGLFFFLIGHFMYIGAITYLSSVNYFLLALFIFIFFGISVFIGFAFRFTFKKLKFGVVPYVFTSSLLLALSLCLLLSKFNDNKSYFFITLASLLFVVSDAILCFLYFKNLDQNLKLKLNRISSYCYLTAQNIFALTIFLI